MSKPKKKKTSQKYKTPENPSPVAGSTSENINKGKNCAEHQQSAQKPQNADNESFWDKEKHWEWTGVAINAVLTIFTALLFYVAIEQTNAAKDSLKVLKESFVADIRIDEDINGIVDYTDSISIRFKNFGNFPAKDVWIHFSSDRRQSDFPDGILSYRNKRHYDFIHSGETKEIFDKPVLDTGDQSNLFLHFKITYFTFEKMITRNIGLERATIQPVYTDCKHSK